MSYTIGVFKRETRDYCLETGIDIGELLESNSEKIIEFDEKDYQFLEEYFKMPAYSGRWVKKSESSELIVYDNMKDVSVEIYQNSIIFKTGWSNSWDLLMVTGDIVLLSKELFQRFNFQEGGWDERIPRSEIVSQEESSDIDIVSIVEGFKSTIFLKKTIGLALVSSNETKEHVSLEKYLQSSGYPQNQVEEICKIVAQKENWINQRSEKPRLLPNNKTVGCISVVAILVVLFFGAIYYLMSFPIMYFTDYNILNWKTFLFTAFLASIIYISFIIFKASKRKRKVV